MGLAVLPARLDTELEAIKKAIINDSLLPKELLIHAEWLTYLKQTYKGKNITEFINNEVANKFMNCIENSGVFKQTKEGIKHFNTFMIELRHALAV